MEMNARARAPALGLAVIGGLLVAEGLVVMAIARRWSTWSIVPVWLGIALLAISAIVARREIRETLRNRRGKVGANVAVMVVAAIALWAIANVIGARNYALVDLSAARTFTVGDQTRKVLAALGKSGKAVRITTLSAWVPIPIEPEVRFALGRVRDLLNTYEAQCAAIEVEHIDSDFEVERLELFLQRFGGFPGMGGLAFECEDRKKAVALDELVEEPRGPDGRPLAGMQPRFSGEQAITAALLSVTEERRRKVYFTQGSHDEADITQYGNFDLGVWASDLRLQNLEVLTLELETAERIPADADVVIVARPDPEILFAERELHLFEKYLRAGGKAMFLLEPLSPAQVEKTVFDPLLTWLERFGARLPDAQIVVDPPESKEHPVLFRTATYGEHEITKSLAGRQVEVFFSRPIEPVAENPEGFRPVPLLYSSERGWSETSIRPEQIREPEFDEATDHRGPVALALALEGKPAGERGTGARIVATGDADLCTTYGMAKLGNRAFAKACLDWLMERESPVSVPSRPLDERRLLDLSPRQRRSVFWITVIGLPFLAMLFGVATWMRRRR